MTSTFQYSLPQPSILAKLKTLDETAPETIMTKAEELAAARREEESRLINRFTRATKSGWRDLMAAMIIYPGPGQYELPGPEKQAMYDKAIAENSHAAIADNFARVGDSMRLAIRAYIDDHGLTEDSLDLDQTERASMVLAFPQPAPMPQTASSGFFRKIFPKL